MPLAKMVKFEAAPDLCPIPRGHGHGHTAKVASSERLHPLRDAKAPVHL